MPVASCHRAGWGCLLTCYRVVVDFSRVQSQTSKNESWIDQVLVMYVSSFEENLSMALNQDLMSDFAIVLVTLLAN